VRKNTHIGPLAVAALLALVVAAGAGCAGAQGPGPAGAAGYRWFDAPAPDDGWSAKIRNWQLRERASRAEPVFDAPASVAGPDEAARAGEGSAGDLWRKVEDFRGERKRAQAREVAAWIQDQARSHYLPDGPFDHWATLEETLRKGGDDCDGLELVAYHLLRDLGFEEDEVFRAIVVRPSDGQHHMVTLWFESPDDPWVIDPTGAMTHGMPRMSERPDWVPLKVFNETGEWTVQARASASPR